MKRMLSLTAFAFVLMLGSSLRNELSAQYNDGYYEDDRSNDNYDRDREVSYQTFYDELSPHGRWIEYPGHGYVWVPDAGPDFRPYSTNGHWVYSNDYEWMWVSDYDWGWAPFHYGRWDHDSYYGWYWVPGYEWSPAWVAWRDGGEYYGWAPIRPGISISLNFNIGMYAPPVNFWVFSPRRYITSPRLYDYCIDPRRNVTIIHHTTIITNNYRYNRNYGFSCGPRRYDAERYIGRINPVRLRTTYSPGRAVYRNNEVSIFRPRVRHDNDRTFAPRRFDRYDANNAGRTNGNENVFRRNNDDRQVNTNSDRKVFDRQNRTADNNNNDRRFERKNDDVIRERQTNPNENRRFERPNNSNGNGNRNGEFRRMERSNDDAVRQQQMEQRRQQQQMEQRRFEKKNDDGVRQQQMEQRRFERKNDDAVRPQKMEQRRQEPQQMEQRRFERKNDDAVRTQQQSQPRQFERRENGNSGKENSTGNGNGRNSKRRFDTPNP